MDSHIISDEDVQAGVEECIGATNFVINRWITTNGVHPKKITDEEIRAIFLGKLRTLVNRKTGSWVDFRKLSKVLYVITGTNRFITNITYSEIDSIYYRNRGFIESFTRSINKIDYIKLQDKVGGFNGQFIDNQYDTVLDFAKLESVKF